MNCPVCKTNIEFKIPEEDTYYDCSNCQSSLLFTQGKCVVINEEKIDTEQKAPTENLTDFEKSQIFQKEEESLEENTNLSKKFSEKSNFDSLTFKETQSMENSQEKSLKETNFIETSQEEKSSLKEQDKEIEDDFYPDEKTEVPELKEESTQSITTEEDREELSYRFEENKSELPTNTQNTSDSDSQQAEDFSDVAEFAKNKEEDIKGIYLYDLTLSEINSQSLKEEVLAVLEDSYLNLSTEENSLHLKNIRDKGQIKILRISPIQTYMIVSSLMGLPLNIHWEQHHIADE